MVRVLGDVLPSTLLLLAWYFTPEITRLLFWIIIPLFWLSFQPAIANGLALVQEAPIYGTLRRAPRRMRRVLATTTRLICPVRSCTARLGLLDSLPAELLPHILASASLTASDLACCAATCSTLARLVTRDRLSDALLWEPACRARWATKAYNPLHLFPKQLEGLSHRERYIWAERDGERTVATVVDVCFVLEWEIKLAGRLPYNIGPFPYRLDGSYVSGSFGGEPRPYEFLAGDEGDGGQHTVRHTASLVIVDGLPPARIVRRQDWGWELRNTLLVAHSLKHDLQSEQVGRVGL